MQTITKIYPVTNITDASEEGILNYLSDQPKSDYRTPIKIEKLKGKYAIKVTFVEE